MQSVWKSVDPHIFCLLSYASLIFFSKHFFFSKKTQIGLFNKMFSSLKIVQYCWNFSASVQFSSVTQLCLTLCDPMNCSTPGLPVYHQLPEFTQNHVHWVGDAIQPSHPLTSPSSSCPHCLPGSQSFPISQLLAWGDQSTGV